MRPVLSPLLAVLVIALSGHSAHADLSLGAVEITPRLDLRATAGSGAEEALKVMQTEVDMRLSVNDDDEELVTFALGPNLATDMEGRGRQMHFGNYYAVWNFGVDKPKLTLGQFVLPFGTLAEYDTHPLVLQTPYARTLGLRIDRGFALEGLADQWNWRAAITTGDGRSRAAGSYAATVRLARNLERGNDSYRVGFSALHGASMPVLHLTAMPVPHHAMPGMGDVYSRARKTRLGLDLDWLHGIDEIRAEFVAGWDDGDFVHGQWVQWSHPFSYRTELSVQGDRWFDRQGVAYGFGVSVHRRLSEESGVRLAWEPRWARPDGGPRESLGLATLQYYREFGLTL